MDDKEKFERSAELLRLAGVSYRKSAVVDITDQEVDLFLQTVDPRPGESLAGDTFAVLVALRAAQLRADGEGVAPRLRRRLDGRKESHLRLAPGTSLPGDLRRLRHSRIRSGNGS